MESNETLTLQEIEQLCRAYIDCRLTRLQELELELAIQSFDFTSPLIEEVSTLMSLSLQMADTPAVVTDKKRISLRFFKYSGIAACIALVAFFAGFLFRNSATDDPAREVYVCADGKILTGAAAQSVVNETERETMDMFRSIIDDVDRQQRLSQQYINSINN